MPCAPLSSLVARARLWHVDVFFLDVEQAELQVLQTIDWSHFSFGALVMEHKPPANATDRAGAHRHDPGDAVHALLHAQGYRFACFPQGGSWSDEIWLGG